MPTKTAPHTLASSLNLLGLCLIVLTSVHLTNSSAMSLIDEIICFLSIILSFSAVLAFFSIRSDNARLESYSDYLFAFSIVIIFGFILYISFKFWQIGQIPIG